MPRNARGPNDLQDGVPAAAPDAAASPPFLTPLAPDPALGWSGLGAGALEPWAHAQAELILREEEDGDEGEDRPRREPRER